MFSFAPHGRPVSALEHSGLCVAACRPHIPSLVPRLALFSAPPHTTCVCARACTRTHRCMHVRNGSAVGCARRVRWLPWPGLASCAWPGVTFCAGLSSWPDQATGSTCTRAATMGQCAALTTPRSAPALSLAAVLCLRPFLALRLRARAGTRAPPVFLPSRQRRKARPGPHAAPCSRRPMLMLPHAPASLSRPPHHLLLLLLILTVHHGLKR